jgi:hypothetical protein
MIALFRANAVFKLGEDVNGNVTQLSADPSMPVRVDLPEGTRLILVSSDETYELIVSQDVRSGSVIIPIQEDFIKAYKGAKVLFVASYIQAQFFMQPNRVKLFANTVEEKADTSLSNSVSAVNLATTANSATTAISARVTTLEGFGIASIAASVVDLDTDLGTIKANVVLTVDVNGNVGTVDLESGATGTSFTVTVDKISMVSTGNIFSSSQLVYAQEDNVIGTARLSNGRLQITEASESATDQITDIFGNAIQLQNAILKGISGDLLNTDGGTTASTTKGFRGIHKSRDGSAGVTTTLTNPTTLVIKDGLIVTGSS